MHLSPTQFPLLLLSLPFFPLLLLSLPLFTLSLLLQSLLLLSLLPIILLLLLLKPPLLKLLPLVPSHPQLGKRRWRGFVDLHNHSRTSDWLAVLQEPGEDVSPVPNCLLTQRGESSNLDVGEGLLEK